uniref:YEATS domain-containing protein 2 n=1 Tax=Oreochromis niloticus TaxID=8128 RepID=A0A669EE31_ORENI
MSGIKRKIEGNDPDYEDVSLVQNSKRNKAAEHSAREATVQKIETIIKEQFSLEMKNKEHEIDVISQRLNEARRMMDKLRACIVANYYASAGLTKLSEHTSKSDPAVLNHPAIRRFLESPSRSSSPLNQGSETPSLVQSESESLSQQGDGAERNGEGAWREESSRQERRPGRNTGKDTFGVPSSAEQRVTYHTTGDDASRLYAKKTIVVGNVSKYIPPDKREENDQSTHKWMVYVRGSRREPSINHFVKKVWFFLHPSYKPNDLVEVSEPPFHLTRRGWGEFPVRIQIHFKDPRNKRIDIIHQLKLDRTYTGLQTLGAETVVDVELHRDSLGEDYIPQPSSSKVTHRAASPTLTTSLAQTYGRSSSPVSHDSSVDKETGRPAGVHSAGLAAGERTPTRPKAGDRVTLGSHGNSAFQPITASCKIVPQGQPPSPAESPGKSFQPITMSCKIVSGSPISTPSHSPLPRTPTTSTPVHCKQSSSSVLNNPYIIVDKPGQVIGMASSSAASTGSPSTKQSATQGTRSPAPKVHTGTFLSSGMKVSCVAFCFRVPLSMFPLQVIIKQEPGEVSTQQQQMVSTVTSQQQQASATAGHQFVAVKGGHMISMSAQKQAGGGTGATSSKKQTSNDKCVCVCVSGLQSSVKQVAISSGQILVAKGNPSVSKVMSGKQVLAQGVAKAIVSGASGISGHQGTKAAGGTGGKSGVMATLQLPANNLANLANLPPGTKLYLTTNSKNPSGKGKLLLIPQGAILRALDGGKSASQHHSLLMAANQAAVISAAKNTSAAGGGSSLSKAAVASLVKGAGNPAAIAKTPEGSAGAVVTGAKGITNMPVISMSKGVGTVVGVPKSSSGASLVSATSAPVFLFCTGMLKIHSGGSSSQQTVLTIPANQLKQLGVGSGSGGLQTIFMPGQKTHRTTSSSKGRDLLQSHTVCIHESFLAPDSCDCLLLSTEHIETMMQLLTAVVKKFPLIVPDKTEDSHPFCASSSEQYYSWNIGKRRASELQRAVAVKRVVQDVLDHSPRLQALTPPKTREVVQWCRQRGYTPPDPEPPQPKNDDESIEDILTQIDNEPECPSTLSSSEELVLRLEQMQALLKTEPEEADDEIVDIITVTPPCHKLKVKEEEQEADPEPKFFLGASLSDQFVSEAAQQIGVTFQPVEVEKNVFAPVIEAMILKVDTSRVVFLFLLKSFLGCVCVCRVPREITAMNIHQAVNSIPTCDFLTNAHMGYLAKDN